MQDKRLMTNSYSAERPAVEINNVLKNTYMLLGLTLAFSAITAAASMAVGMGRGASLICMLVAFGAMFMVHRNADSAKGLVWVFVFTGLLGASLGPMLSHYLSMPNGSQLVFQAMGGTAIIFFTLSGYALVSRKDFSFMGGFLLVGLVVAVLASIANIFLAIPGLYLATSAAIVLIMSGLILFDTSNIIHGGETNYIRATVGLYLSVYNIFVHLLAMLGIMDD